MGVQLTAPPRIGRVAIIDDDTRYAALIEHEFNALGYEVTRLGCAEGLSEKLSALEAAIVVVEPRCAGESELGIVAAIRDLVPGAWLVVHSAHASVSSAVHAIREGASDYVPKPATAKRLINCSVKIIDSLMPAEESETTIEVESWEGFSFKREVLKIEKKFIERALRDAGGSVTRASRLLGFRHHQSLIALINSRHRDLLGTRSAVRKRRHHLFSKPRRARKPETAAENGNKEIDAVSGTVPTSESN